MKSCEEGNQVPKQLRGIPQERAVLVLDTFPRTGTNVTTTPRNLRCSHGKLGPVPEHRPCGSCPMFLLNITHFYYYFVTR